MVAGAHTTVLLGEGGPPHPPPTPLAVSASADPSRSASGDRRRAAFLCFPLPLPVEVIVGSGRHGTVHPLAHSRLIRRFQDRSTGPR